jgi:hypothetical protein
MEAIALSATAATKPKALLLPARIPHAFSPTLSYRLDQGTKARGVVFKTALLLPIDHVYRNKIATHLAEFHKIEWVINDKNLTLKT